MSPRNKKHPKRNFEIKFTHTKILILASLHGEGGEEWRDSRDRLGLNHKGGVDMKEKKSGSLIRVRC